MAENKTFKATISTGGEVKSYAYWTNSAKMCFNRNCNCKGCYYENYFSDTDFKCQMKNSIIELKNKFGVPKQKTNQSSENAI